MGAPRAGRQKDPRHGTAGRQAIEKGQPAGTSLCLQRQVLRDQEMQIAEQAERNYARFVARWKTRPSGEGVRERRNPARQE